MVDDPDELAEVGMPIDDDDDDDEDDEYDDGEIIQLHEIHLAYWQSVHLSVSVSVSLSV